jgi:Flp pilus assembly pilin Flp
MKYYLQRFRTLLADEDGVTSVEYAVVLAMILMTILGAIGSVGDETGKMWSRIEGDLTDVGFIK